MILQRGLTIISPGQVREVQETAEREKIPLYTISLGGQGSREALFNAVRTSLPLDPPLMSSRSWDALSDSLWQGLYELKVPRIVILWPESGPLRKESPQEFDTAIAVLTSLTEELADQESTVGSPTEVCIYVGD